MAQTFSTNQKLSRMKMPKPPANDWRWDKSLWCNGFLNRKCSFQTSCLIKMHAKLCVGVCDVLTLSLTCVRLRSHFSLGLEGEKEAESVLYFSWVFTKSQCITCQTIMYKYHYSYIAALYVILKVFIKFTFFLYCTFCNGALFQSSFKRTNHKKISQWSDEVGVYYNIHQTKLQRILMILSKQYCIIR